MHLARVCDATAPDDVIVRFRRPPAYPGMPPPMGFLGHLRPWGFPPGLGPPPGMPPPHMLAQSLPPQAFAPPSGTVRLRRCRRPLVRASACVVIVGTRFTKASADASGAPANGAAPQLFPISLPASAEGSKQTGASPLLWLDRSIERSWHLSTLRHADHAVSSPETAPTEATKTE